MRRLFLFVIIVTAISVGSLFGQVSIVHPTVEYQDGSQPLATNVPRFSWRYSSDKLKDVEQVTYRIIVASTEENARNDIGDLWDSKTVASNQMLLIPYEGKPLHSRDKAYWKVITSVAYPGEYQNQGYGTLAVIKWTVSDINYFEVSLLDSADWKAKWIGGEFYNDDIHGKTRIASRYLRKEFSLSKNIREARLYVSGLGQYSAYLNGQEVAPEEILKPALSDYTKRVYFNAYDVTDFLKKGSNAVGVTLAGGRYTTIRYDEKEMEYGGLTHAKHFGTPRLLLQLEVT